MKQTETKITRYEVRGYFIDITDNGKEYEAWISKKGEGVSVFMFGMPIAQQSYDAFVDIVDGQNLKPYKAMLKAADISAWWEAPDNK